MKLSCLYPVGTTENSQQEQVLFSGSSALILGSFPFICCFVPSPSCLFYFFSMGFTFFNKLLAYYAWRYWELGHGSEVYCFYQQRLTCFTKLDRKDRSSASFSYVPIRWSLPDSPLNFLLLLVVWDFFRGVSFFGYLGFVLCMNFQSIKYPHMLSRDGKKLSCLIILSLFIMHSDDAIHCSSFKQFCCSYQQDLNSDGFFMLCFLDP